MASDEAVLLGDEAIALGAVHAGLGAAYGYPGTPSTEILEYLIKLFEAGKGPRAAWCANEKTAYEEALGASFSGRRVLVTMKHVGLNVAADPFVNSALVAIKGGLVLAVADDPGMHSSQDEQDSRFYAEFAMIPCLEPTDQEEAYEDDAGGLRPFRALPGSRHDQDHDAPGPFQGRGEDEDAARGQSIGQDDGQGRVDPPTRQRPQAL